MNVSRRYTTTLDFPELGLTVILTHLPSEAGTRPTADSVAQQLGGGLRGMVSPGGGDQGNPDAPRHLRRMLHALVEQATGCAPLPVDTVLAELGTGESQLGKEAATQDALDYVLAAPVVAVEGSWPRMSSLTEIVFLVGGVGAATLGVLTGQSDVVEYGMVLATTGAVVVEVRGRAGSRENPDSPPRATADDVDPTTPLGERLAAEFAEIEKMPFDKKRTDELKFAATKREVESGGR